MSVAAKMIIGMVSNEIHVLVVEARLVNGARFTVEEFDAAVDEAVASGLIRENGSYLVLNK